MKVTKKQLEKLVLEELESSLVDESLTDFITKGMEKLRVPNRPKLRRQATAQKKMPQSSNKQQQTALAVKDKNEIITQAQKDMTVILQDIIGDLEKSKPTPDQIEQAMKVILSKEVWKKIVDAYLKQKPKELPPSPPQSKQLTSSEPDVLPQ